MRVDPVQNAAAKSGLSVPKRQTAGYPARKNEL
jgi:hypothetical protein